MRRGAPRRHLSHQAKGLRTRPGLKLPARLAALPGRAAKSAAGSLCLRPRFVNIDRATAEISAVQGSNCAVRLSRIRHFDKGKAACATRVSVSHQVDPLHFSIRLEECTERRFGSTEIQIPYKDVFHVVNVCLSIVRARRGRYGFGQVVAGRQKLDLSVPRPESFDHDAAPRKGLLNKGGTLT